MTGSKRGGIVLQARDRHLLSELAVMRIIDRDPLSIDQVARLIGCSPWTVRQTLIPRGLPHFRFKASGRLIFYRDQVIRWIEKQQQGGF